ncbi:MAG: SH3 domain-containing protein [Clostridia bacterium]|nr:SH3 domain-containing protein [Clostridia bacterium]
MKRFLTFILVVIMTVCSFSEAFAIGSNSVEPVGRIGRVICTSCSLREQPDTSSTRYASLKNSTVVSILGESGEWYAIDLAVIEQEGIGYIFKKYIRADPYYITLPKTVILWADPFGSGKANGEKDKGNELLVISETAEWYCVQTRESSAGSSFIRKSDLGIYSGSNQGYQDDYYCENDYYDGNDYYYGAGTYMVKCTTLGVYPEPNDDLKRIGFLHYQDKVQVLELGDYFTKISYNLDGTNVVAYVHTEHLIKVYE